MPNKKKVKKKGLVAQMRRKAILLHFACGLVS